MQMNSATPRPSAEIVPLTVAQTGTVGGGLNPQPLPPHVEPARF